MIVLRKKIVTDGWMEHERLLRRVTTRGCSVDLSRYVGKMKLAEDPL